MSERLSALPGADFDGLVKVREAGLQGMITLRGNLGSAKLKAAATNVTGVEFPGQREARVEGERGLLWMSPDELLLLVPYGEVTASLGILGKTLKGSHHLAVDVSDARAVFHLTDGPAREVLAKLSPADLHPVALPPGELRRTRAAQVPVAFWLDGEGAARLICFRSVAQYVFDLLCAAADPKSAVAHF